MPDLIRLTEDRTVDAIGLNPGAIHALWTLHGLGGPDAVAGPAVGALKHPSAGVRRNALLVAPRDERSAGAILASGALRDDDAQVRLAALLALAEMPASEAVAASLVESLLAGTAEGDPTMADAVVIAASAHDRAFLKALAARKLDRPAGGSVLAVAERVAEHHARGVPSASIVSTLAALEGADRGVAGAVIAGLARGWPEGRPASLDAGSEETLGRLLPRLAPEARGALVGLANRWGAKGLERYTAEIAGSLLAQASDESRPDEARIDAARQYVELRKKDPDAARELIALVTPRTPPALATALIEAAGRSEAPGVGAILVDRLGALTPGVRPVALRALLGRGDWTAALLEGVEGGKVRLDELSLDQKQALAAHPDSSIAGLAKRLLSRGGGLPDPDRQKVIDELAPIVLRGGDAARGKEVFRQQCAKCHAHSGEGGKVGPDLTGMAAHPAAELLVHILDPSRSVEGNFVQYTVATTDGRILNGLLASETKTAVELVDAEGKAHVVQRADIDELVSSKKSLMPEGFDKQVPPAAIADLLAFLTARGKFLPLDLRAAATSVSTRGMFVDANDPDERLSLLRLVAEDVRGDAVPARRPAGRPGAERDPPARPEGDVPAEDAPIGGAPLRDPGAGGPHPGRGERVGVPPGTRKARSR